jgi:excinuclease ABC subunit C
MRTVTSELLRIRGVGEAKRRQLLEAFGSLQGVRDASLEAIAALPGFSTKTARKVFDGLREPTTTAVDPTIGPDAPESDGSVAALPTSSPDHPPTSS